MDVGISETVALGPFSIADGDGLLSGGGLLSFESASSVETSGRLPTDWGSLEICFGVSGETSEALSLGLAKSLSSPGESSSVWACETGLPPSDGDGVGVCGGSDGGNDGLEEVDGDGAWALGVEAAVVVVDDDVDAAVSVVLSESTADSCSCAPDE